MLARGQCALRYTAHLFLCAFPFSRSSLLCTYPETGAPQSRTASPPSCDHSPWGVTVRRVLRRFLCRHVLDLVTLIVWRAGDGHGVRTAPHRGFFTLKGRVECDSRLGCQSCTPCCMYMYLP
ncbi:hypothetical protein DFH11DRAFT_1600258, partial [Phellopilus nigrolimitatus]